VSPSSKEEKSDEDAMPVDVSTTTGQYVSSSKADVKPKGGERQISTPADAYASPDELPPAAKSSATSDAYASPKQQVVSSSSQPMAGGSPDELPPVAKSSATSDAYASPKQQVVSSSSQPMAGGSPDELPPAAKSSATSDPYLSSKQQVLSSQPMAGGSPDELPPAAKSSGTPDPYASVNVPNEPAVAGKPKLSMETFSGMIKRPIAKFLSPVIKSVCAKTEYPEDCETSIGALPGAASAAATDSVGVLKLAMEAVREKVIVAMNAATDRMNVPGTDATTKDALDSCTSSYSDIKTSLDSVDDALKRGDVDTAHTNLDSVETDITTCDDGFQEHGIPSVMTDHDQELQKLASNLLSIGAAIHH
jgi:pectinesterase inhibitor-like protein